MEKEKSKEVFTIDAVSCLDLIISQMIFSLLTISILVAGVFIHFSLIIIGGVLAFVDIIMSIQCVFFREMYVSLYPLEIQITTIKGKLKKQKLWSDLQSIEIKPQIIQGRPPGIRGDYICLNFSKELAIPDLLEDSRFEEDLIVIYYSKEKLKFIQKHTDIEINTENMKNFKSQRK